MAEAFQTRMRADDNPNWRGGWAVVSRRLFRMVGRYRARDIQRLLTRQCGQCAYCHEDIRKAYTIDHIMPLTRGGTNFIGNIQLVCGWCNRQKHTRLSFEYRLWLAKNGRQR